MCLYVCVYVLGHLKITAPFCYCLALLTGVRVLKTSNNAHVAGAVVLLRRMESTTKVSHPRLTIDVTSLVVFTGSSTLRQFRQLSGALN